MFSKRDLLEEIIESNASKSSISKRFRKRDLLKEISESNASKSSPPFEKETLLKRSLKAMCLSRAHLQDRRAGPACGPAPPHLWARAWAASRPPGTPGSCLGRICESAPHARLDRPSGRFNLLHKRTGLFLKVQERGAHDAANGEP
jgi:hypothetical protein